MPELPPDSEVVFADRNRSVCEGPYLVLTAVGIAATLRRHKGEWLLVVDPSDYQRAIDELDEYEQENAEAARAISPDNRSYDYVAAGIAGYWVVLLAVGMLARWHVLDADWLEDGAMHAGRLLDGQWWRAVTALTLHRDAAHLAGNLVFGAVFGWMVAETFGGGIGWLAIVAAGSLGNAVNAAVQEGAHRSIGASTAVYAALGIVVARYIRPRSAAGESSMKRYRPLIGGVVLLTFTGISGERTDVMAHVAGFVAGIAVGTAAGLASPRLLASRPVQQVAGGLCIGIILVAWIVALR